MKKQSVWGLLAAAGIALVLLICGCEPLQPAKWVAPADIGGWWQQEWHEDNLTQDGRDLGDIRNRSTIAIVQNGESIEMGMRDQWDGLPDDYYYFEGTYRNGIVDVHQQWTPEIRHHYRFLSENRMVELWDTQDEVTGDWVEDGDPEAYRDDEHIYIRKGGENDPFPQ